MPEERYDFMMVIKPTEYFESMVDQRWKDRKKLWKQWDLILKIKRKKNILTPQQRKVLVYYLQNKATKVIGKKLNITTRAVTAIINRIIKICKKEVKKEKK